MEGRVTNSGWEELLAAPGKSETGKLPYGKVRAAVAILKQSSVKEH